MKRIPVTTFKRDGILDGMDGWAFDVVTGMVIIQRRSGQHLRFIDPNELMKFHERDIYKLSKTPLICESEMFEPETKPFVQMVSRIIEEGLWAGKLQAKELHILNQPIPPP